jgi:hypothetical protein
MIILSVDIGFVNYSFVCFYWDSVSSWKPIYVTNQNTGLKKSSNIIQISKNIKKMFDEFIDILTKQKFSIDEVIIEKQPGKRLIMERIFAVTVSYFTILYPKIKIKMCIRKFDVVINSNSNSNIHGRKNYHKRKLLAVEIGKKCLFDKTNKFCLENIDICNWIDEKFEKKDDIFDAILLVLSYQGYKLS